MIQIRLCDREIQDLCSLLRCQPENVVAKTEKFIADCRELDQAKYEGRILERIIGGKDILLNLTQQGKIQLPLFIQFLQLLNNRNEPYEILI